MVPGSCVIPRCDCEGPERSDWPMADSPASFFAPCTFFDSDDFDVEVIASRLPGLELDSEGVARTLGCAVSAVWVLVKRGQIPPPHRYEETERNHRKGVWTARQVAGVLIARGRVPA